MFEIVEKAKKEFYHMVDDFGSDPYHLLSHVPKVEKLAEYMLKKYTEADAEVVLLSAWLHDLGHYPVPAEIDHAIRGEERSRVFLEKEHYPEDKMNKVLHCIRAHRCRDIMPDSLEAKIVACIDSASHMLDFVYLDMAQGDKENKREFSAYLKMERDYRDLGSFPEIQNEFEGIYEAWKELIKAYEKIDLD